jgi:hypothetical protein
MVCIVNELAKARALPLALENDQPTHIHDWLEQAKALVKHPLHSLIPQEKTYIQKRYQYRNYTSRAGFQNLHGLRHAYAQARFLELTGFLAPISGGLTAKAMTKEQEKKDDEARRLLAKELGHNRKQIMLNYLSR